MGPGGDLFMRQNDVAFCQKNTQHLNRFLIGKMVKTPA